MSAANVSEFAALLRKMNFTYWCKGQAHAASFILPLLPASFARKLMRHRLQKLMDHYTDKKQLPVFDAVMNLPRLKE